MIQPCGSWLPDMGISQRTSTFCLNLASKVRFRRLILAVESLCGKPGKRNGEDFVSKTEYLLNPIGYIQSPLKDRAQAPRQGNEGAPDAWIEVNSAVAEG